MQNRSHTVFPEFTDKVIPDIGCPPKELLFAVQNVLDTNISIDNPPLAQRFLEINPTL